jgi:cell shape-determining protein MreC
LQALKKLLHLKTKLADLKKVRSENTRLKKKLKSAEDLEEQTEES